MRLVPRKTPLLAYALSLFILASVGAGFYVAHPSAAQDKSAQGAALASTKAAAAIERDYAKLVADIRFGLRQKGVSSVWRDNILKRLAALQKRGLSAKKVSEAKALIGRLQVGGEKGARVAVENCAEHQKPKFTHAFTDLSKIDALNPIGGIGGGSPGRSYIGVKAGMEAPIYAPMSATLRTIVFADRGAGYGEYGLIFTAGCGVEFLFDHIDRVSEKIAKYAPKTAAPTSQVPGETVNLSIKAGELLGYSNGTDLARTFDFLVTDYSRKNAFLNPERWEWEQATNAVCPYDFFIPELKAQYYEKLGKPSDTGLIKAHACGNPSHDVASTLSGGWFKAGSTDKRGEYLAIARQYDEVMVAYRKDGEAFASREDVQRGKPFLRITDMSPKKYPADVGVGESVCYSGNGEWAFAWLVSSTTLELAKGAGECPSRFPSSGTDTWMR